MYQGQFAEVLTQGENAIKKKEVENCNDSDHLRGVLFVCLFCNNIGLQCISMGFYISMPDISKHFAPLDFIIATRTMNELKVSLLSTRIYLQLPSVFTKRPHLSIYGEASPVYLRRGLTCLYLPRSLTCLFTKRPHPSIFTERPHLSEIGPAVRADFRRLYPANAKTPTCCPSDDNRTKVTNSVTSARSLWWHVGPYFWPADLTRTANPIVISLGAAGA